MNRKLGASLTGLVLATVIAVPISAAHAAAPDFKLTTVERLASFELVGDQAFIETEGSGHSSLLGHVTSTSSVIQTLVPGCDPASAVITLSAEGGTLTIAGEALVCVNEIVGAWEVTGGTGEFAGATGGGTILGKPNHAGTDPVVLHYAGSLSF